MKTINFNNISSKAIRNQKELLREISSVINSGSYLYGPQNQKLELSLKKFLNSKNYLTTVASGHDALLLSLSSLSLKPTNEILFPSLSYPTAFPVYLTNGKPVAVDTNSNGRLTLEIIKSKITKKTKVVIVTHLYGLTEDIEAISKFCRTKKIIMIEDCAQAFGTTFKNKFVGTFGDFGCFSFYPTKNLGTLGDGGAILVKSKKNYDYIQKAKAYGSSHQYHSQFIAGHSRLPEIQAAILNVYLKSFPAEVTKRQKVFGYYSQSIIKHKLANHLRLLQSHPNSQPCPHLLVVQAENRRYLQKFLEQNNIPTLIHYPKLIFKLRSNLYPISTQLTQSILSLPFHPDLTKQEVDHIIRTIKMFYQSV